MSQTPLEKTRVFVTVGTQCPFPRLLNAVDKWARDNPSVSVIAQTAEDDATWENVECIPFLEPHEYRQHLADSDLVIGHAGTGTLFASLEFSKPLIMVPRQAGLGEHRNDHQLGTVRRLGQLPGVRVVEQLEELSDVLDDQLSTLGGEASDPQPSQELIDLIRCEIEAACEGNSNNQVLAVASGGGHWVELCRLLQPLRWKHITCATTDLGDSSLAGDVKVVRIPDGNRWNKWQLLKTAMTTFRLVLQARPSVVLSTGAAPGYFAMLAGHLVGARTIWLDSIANVDELSLSGKKVKSVASVWLTQWPELSRPDGPAYAGSVIPVAAPSVANSSPPRLVPTEA